MHRLAVSTLSFHSPQHLLLVVALMMVILTHVRLDLIVALVCISPVNIDVKNLSCVSWPFVCFLWKKCLFSSSAHFLLFFILSHMSSLYIFGDKSLVGLIFFKYFLPSCGFLSVLFTVSHAVEKLLSLIRFHLLIF